MRLTGEAFDRWRAETAELSRFNHHICRQDVIMLVVERRTPRLFAPERLSIAPPLASRGRRLPALGEAAADERGADADGFGFGRDGAADRPVEQGAHLLRRLLVASAEVDTHQHAERLW